MQRGWTKFDSGLILKTTTIKTSTEKEAGSCLAADGIKLILYIKLEAVRLLCHC